MKYITLTFIKLVSISSIYIYFISLVNFLMALLKSAKLYETGILSSSETVSTILC